MLNLTVNGVGLMIGGLAYEPIYQTQPLLVVADGIGLETQGLCFNANNQWSGVWVPQAVTWTTISAPLCNGCG